MSKGQKNKLEELPVDKVRQFEQRNTVLLDYIFAFQLPSPLFFISFSFIEISLTCNTLVLGVQHGLIYVYIAK